MNVSYSNWWDDGQSDKWFKPFLMRFFGNYECDIRLYSVFGDSPKLTEPFDGVKIFYSSENLEPPTGLHAKDAVEWQKIWMNIYDDYAMDEMDISLGYGYRNEKKYLRFPGFIRSTFSPDSDLKSIRKRVNEINASRVNEAAKGIVVVARHDSTFVRTEICDVLEKWGGQITYAGKWRNNTDRLWNEYHNHKVLFLKEFQFNICAENMNAEGYCTEKIHDCFKAGAIPIYYGANNMPEPGLINNDAIIFWDCEGSNADNLKMIEEIASSRQRFEEFSSQDRYYPEMTDYVFDTINRLHDMIFDCIKQRRRVKL